MRNLVFVRTTPCNPISFEKICRIGLLCRLSAYAPACLHFQPSNLWIITAASSLASATLGIFLHSRSALIAALLAFTPPAHHRPYSHMSPLYPNSLLSFATNPPARNYVIVQTTSPRLTRLKTSLMVTAIANSANAMWQLTVFKSLTGFLKMLAN